MAKELERTGAGKKSLALLFGKKIQFPADATDVVAIRLIIVVRVAIVQVHVPSVGTIIVVLRRRPKVVVRPQLPEAAIFRFLSGKPDLSQRKVRVSGHNSWKIQLAES